MSSPKKYRVVQWATGNVGSRALRRAIEHPAMEVVGVWVHGASKVGRDAGELAGIAPIGVKATNRIEDVLALKPDCVLYMPHVCNYDEICAILESGANIVTTRMELQNPKALDPAIAARVEAACQRGNSSIHATGASPGFITEAVPIVLASIQRRLDLLNINEYADCSSRNSPEMLFEMMGFGQKPGAANRVGPRWRVHRAGGDGLSREVQIRAGRRRLIGGFGMEQIAELGGCLAAGEQGEAGRRHDKTSGTPTHTTCSGRPPLAGGPPESWRALSPRGGP